nr:hypothetical protein [Tanacetum cinerariifolium]
MGWPMRGGLGGDGVSNMLSRGVIEKGEEHGLDSKEDEVVPKVEDVSLVDGVFDGTLGRDGDKDFAIGERAEEDLFQTQVVSEPLENSKYEEPKQWQEMIIMTVTHLKPLTLHHQGLDVESVNIPYLLAWYLGRFAAGRKSGALISGGQFAPQPPPTARTMPQRMARLDEDVHEIRRALAEQRKVIDSMAKYFSRFIVWAAEGISHQLDSARVNYTPYSKTHIPYQIHSLQHTSSFQHTAREDSSIEVAASPPKSKLKPIRVCQKRTIQNEDAPWQTTWTNEKEITLCKGWIHVLKRNPKWMDTEVPKFLSNPHASKRYKIYGSSSFNTESGDASINLNVDVRNDKEYEVHELRRPMGRDKAKGLKKRGPRSSGSSSNTNDEG